MSRSEVDNNTKALHLHQSPRKKEEFQTTKMPPEAPIEGEKAKLSKRLGQNERINL
jgi:hypothetical protein